MAHKITAWISVFWACTSTTAVVRHGEGRPFPRTILVLLKEQKASPQDCIWSRLVVDVVDERIPPVAGRGYRGGGGYSELSICSESDRAYGRWTMGYWVLVYWSVLEALRVRSSFTRCMLLFQLNILPLVHHSVNGVGAEYHPISVFFPIGSQYLRVVRRIHRQREK